jgi:hypothetical protein
MRLSSKYVTGFGIVFSILFIFFIFDSSPKIDVIDYFFLIFLNQTPSPLPYLFFGIIMTLVGIMFYYLLFSPETIKGHQLEFEASPDLTTFRVVKRVTGKSTNTEVEVPDTGYCSACGKQIHKPFRCQTCGQILCGTHYLPGDHQCKEGHN